MDQEMHQLHLIDMHQIALRSFEITFLLFEINLNNSKVWK
jgi:hypothetical protein